MRETKYYCDCCEKEIDRHGMTKGQFRPFIAGLSSSGPSIKYVDFNANAPDLCFNCMKNELIEFLNKNNHRPKRK